MNIIPDMEMERIVRNAMADTWEKLSREPQYAHCASRLRRMAEIARTKAAATTHGDQK